MLRQQPGLRMPVLWSVIACAIIACGSRPAEGIGPLFGKSDPMGPKTNAQAKAQAIQSIPRKLLDPQALAKVDGVLADTAMYRRLPIRVMPCDPDMYLFLVRQPDVVVNIWDVLKMSNLAMEQTGPTSFDMVDNAGTEGTVEFLYQSADTHIIFSEGRYRGPLIKKPITGRSIVVLKTGYVREPDGRYFITSRLDAFVQVDHEGLELLTKTIHPLVGKVADVNFTQTVAFVGSLSKTAEVDPDGVRRLASQLDKVMPNVAREFAQVSGKVAIRAAQQPMPSTHGVPSVARRPAGARTR
jgi:hypothetical protein